MIRAQRPADATPPPIVEEPSILEGYLEDASGAPAGRARGLVRPANEREAAAFLRFAAQRGLAILPQAARTSLTGGAIPSGEVVVSCERMCECDPAMGPGGATRRAVGPGVRLREFQSSLASEGFYFPPVPTHQEAMVGGVVSTNAGGAATFKYGVTRQWVSGLRVLLANGDLLVLERGKSMARPGESFRIERTDGTEIRIPAPSYELPPLQKISAGYHAADPLDLIDLFIGSEGTLGLITGVRLDVIRLPPALLTGLIFFRGRSAGLALAAALREAAIEARRRDDGSGPDVRAIEWIDAGSLTILRGAGVDRRLRIPIPSSARELLWFEMEIDRPTTNRQAQRLLELTVERREPLPDHPLVRLYRLLDERGLLDDLELAFPEDDARRRAFADLREAVPSAVTELLAGRRRGEPEVRKVGGDMIVPFEHVKPMVDVYAEGFARRGLDYAIWGHLGDGNLHANALPRDAAEVRRGFDALMEFGREVARRGGAPLSEHGVGRNPVKQALLEQFLGCEAVREMRAIKAALDPEGRLARGVVFPS